MKESFKNQHDNLNKIEKELKEDLKNRKRIKRRFN